MWYMDIQDVVYTKVKIRATKKLVDKYPNITFTKSNNGQIDAKFPTVYISYLQSPEQDKDLERNKINGVQLNVQVNVTVSKSQGELVAKEVMAYVIEEFKYMSFDAYSTPIFMRVGEETRQMSAYLRRNVGRNDEIL